MFWTMPRLGAPIVDVGPSITFVAGTAVSFSGGSATPIGKPSGTAEDDHLILAVFGNFSTPALAGWNTKIIDVAGALDLAIFDRVAGASEPSSYEVSGTPNARAGLLLAYRGGTGVVDTVGSYSQASSLTANAPSITPDNPGLLLAIYGIRAASRTIATPPSGMTARTSVAGSANASAASYEQTPSAASASGDKTAIWSGTSDPSGGILLQLT